MKIAIVGYGILGKAIYDALKDTNELVIIDPPAGYYGSITGVNNYILCLPTPESADGSCDTSLVESYIRLLCNKDGNKVLLKSTVNPKVLLELAEKYDFSYSPEFLREESSFEDFKFQRFAIFSGPDASEWHDIMAKGDLTMVNISYTSIRVAALTKYAINTFLATKVIYFNELAELAGDDFSSVISNMSMDKRIGDSHMQVPGPDGKNGFGGMCFPKDTAAFADYARKENKPLTLLEGVIKINKEIR